ncbi:MAG: hypothetical protein M1481_03745 [Candidatus Thermoplasmatota archaeon]|nr:hypothetical protein [Candidatus Thermoplasmatota archaeon]MCL5963374.1 hypothetical protein [Candidatus Thermoplasmatota archaeon]
MLYKDEQKEVMYVHDWHGYGVAYTSKIHTIRVLLINAFHEPFAKQARMYGVIPIKFKRSNVATSEVQC